MYAVKKQLEERQKYLGRLTEEKEEALKGAPKGFLHICKKENKLQYYVRKDSGDAGGEYIRQKDIEVAAKLAQRDYDRQVIRAAEKEQMAIERYQKSLPEADVEHLFEGLHVGRKCLVTPVCQTEEQFVESWKKIQFQEKGFEEGAPEFFSAKGERMRSKSEVLIADMLEREGIPYRYEAPIVLRGIGRIYPDFTVLNVRLRKEIYWEHLGMMDHLEYAENALNRIGLYEKNEIWPGNNLILTYESRKNPLNQKLIQRTIEHYLK